MVWTTRAIFALAALQYLWNIARAPPLSGYDGAGHAAYALTLLEEGRLPHPLEGLVDLPPAAPPDSWCSSRARWPAPSTSATCSSRALPFR